ncbi:transposase family protein [Streptomyces sp. 6-11-2]|uniref:transposase family protein n=1 Tax=Streptomyces sp. 6-11-2 TaxID=2585753 RepID=UPI0035A6A273
MEVSKLQDPQGCRARVSSSCPTPVTLVAPLRLIPSSAPAPPPGLLDALVRVPDPRDRRGRRFKLATLLAIGVCAMTAAGHNSLTAIAEWAHRCDQETLAALGRPGLPVRPVRWPLPGPGRADPARSVRPRRPRRTDRRRLPARRAHAAARRRAMPRQHSRTRTAPRPPRRPRYRPPPAASARVRRGRQMPAWRRPPQRLPRLRAHRCAPRRRPDRGPA